MSDDTVNVAVHAGTIKHAGVVTVQGSDTAEKTITDEGYIDCIYITVLGLQMVEIYDEDDTLIYRDMLEGREYIGTSSGQYSLRYIRSKIVIGEHYSVRIVLTNFETDDMYAYINYRVV